jgi:hypothetical protein
VLPRYAKRTMRQVAAGQKKKRLSQTEADDCQNDNSRVVRIVGTKWRKSLKTLERVKGIEPSSSAWKAVALPLSYTRAGGQQSDAGNQAVGLSDDRPLLLVPGMVGEVGLEPTKA